MKHTTRWSVEAQWEKGNGSLRAYTQALPEWGGQLPKTPRFNTKAWAGHLKGPGSSPCPITNSIPWATYFTFLNCKTGMVELHTSKRCCKPGLC